MSVDRFRLLAARFDGTPPANTLILAGVIGSAWAGPLWFVRLCRPRRVTWAMHTIAGEGVSFAYGVAPILYDLSVVVEVGECSGLLGPKRFREVDSTENYPPRDQAPTKEILIPRQDIRTLGQHELAGLIAVVPRKHQVIFLCIVEESAHLTQP